jgi:hypothetical protein
LPTGATRQYTAIFAIGGRLLGSFKGAMAFAEARMRRLRALSLSFATGLKKIGAVAVGAFAGAFAGFGLSKIFSGMFEGAADQAVEVEQRTRALTFSLLKLNVIRKGGLPIAREQAALIEHHNALLSRQGVLSEEIYGELAKTLSLYGVPPKQIMASSAAMGDLLVATRGVTATTEDATSLARGLARAIYTGQGRALIRYGIIIDKNWKKEHVTYQSRLDSLMSMMQAYKGVNKAAENTPIGRIQKWRNELLRTRIEIGNEILPIQAEMADRWRTALPQMKPAIIFVFKGLLAIMLRVSRFITTRLIPAVNELRTWWERQGPEQRRRWTNLAIWIGGVVAAMIALNAAAVLVGFSLKGAFIGLAVAGVIASIVKVRNAYETTQALIASKPVAIAPDYATNQQQWNELFIGIQAAWITFKQWWTDQGGLDWNTIMGNLRKWWSDTFAELRREVSRLKDDLTHFDWTFGFKTQWHDAIDQWRHFWHGPAAMPQAPPAPAAARAASRLPNPPPAANAAANLPVDIPPADISSQDAAARAVGGRSAADAAARAAKLRGFQEGGLVTKPTIARIAEKQPEVVIPFDQWVRRLGTSGYPLDPKGRAMAPTRAAYDAVYGHMQKATPPPHVTFSPHITINGNATEEEQRSLDTRLRDLSRDFIKQFVAAQRQSRRLSFEGGYG